MRRLRERLGSGAVQNSFLHIQTLTLVTTLLTTLVGALLLLAWWRARPHRILVWWAISYFFAAVGTLLLSLRGQIPHFLSIEIANALVILACASAWAATRSFEGRGMRAAWMVCPALAWIALCQIPLVAGSVPVRIAIMSLIMATFIFLGASELWQGRKERLVSRWPAILTMAVYGIALLSRIPMLLFIDTPAAPVLFQGSSWFGIVSLVSLVYIVVMGCNVLAMAKERMELSYRHKARTDSLTQLFTRRAFFDEGEEALSVLKRTNASAAVMVVDLDSFKQINDRFGHLIGDAVLQVFASTVRTVLRDADIVGRIGGEEFAILLPGYATREATGLAERLRVSFESEAREVNGEHVGATLSAGVAVAQQNGKLIRLLADADRALYAAKQGGRNCVRVASVDVVVEAPRFSKPRAA